MPKILEKKYRVPSFEHMLAKIDEFGATPTIDIQSTHYYAHLDTDDTLKMIDYGDKVEIHKVSTKNGLHSIDEEIRIASVEAGYKWFKERGFDELDVLEMRVHTTNILLN